MGIVDDFESMARPISELAPRESAIEAEGD